MIDTPAGTALDGQHASALAQVATDIGTAVTAWFGDVEQIAWLHTDHFGAVEGTTDDAGRVLWRARYDPFGKIIEVAAAGSKGEAGRFALELRLPGQYEDSETGLYYNGRRYYDPQRGRYLTPDPLGTPDGPDPYAYVGNNPLRYIDPSGLVLFAFDGTGNTDDLAWLHENGSSLSNVWNFRQLYEDGNRRYVTGVGTVHHDSQYGDINPSDYVPSYIPLADETADMGANYSGPARIARMVQYFNDEAGLVADDDAVMDVDIVGFSRGAAEARDFANRIVSQTTNGWYRYTVKDASGSEVSKCQRVNMRFMGLYDTVLSTNWSGYSYNLAIPDAFSYVAQAVALNEYRGALTHPYFSTGAFPGESIMPDMHAADVENGKTRIERGFIGSHADIGGGFGENDSQLAQVALAWMVRQAEIAGIQMGDSPLLHTIIANPVVHDKSTSILTGAPARNAEDRTVTYGDGSKVHQREMRFAAGMTWADSQEFIQYLPENDPQRPSFITGTVDMQAYLDWLNANGYHINLTVQ